MRVGVVGSFGGTCILPVTAPLWSVPLTVSEIPPVGLSARPAAMRRCEVGMAPKQPEGRPGGSWRIGRWELEPSRKQLHRSDVECNFKAGTSFGV